MPAPDAIYPVAALLLIVCIHVMYWRRHAHVDSQHDVEVNDLTASSLVAGTQRAERILHQGAKQFAGRHVALNAKGEICTASSAAFSQRSGDPARTARTGLLSDESERPIGRCIVEPMICEDDLHIDDTVTFFAPLKVGGDLVVNGLVRFRGPVTVNGYFNVNGRALVGRGMIVKEDVSVAGQLTVGSLDNPSWLVARKLTLEGDIALNGEVETSEGVYF